jgi:hypothetical protein
MSFYIYIYKSSFPCFWLNHIEQTGLNRQKRVRCASELFAVTSSQVMCCPHQAIQGPGFFFRVGLIAPHVIGMFSILGSILSTQQGEGFNNRIFQLNRPVSSNASPREDIRVCSLGNELIVWFSLVQVTPMTVIWSVKSNHISMVSN